MVIAVSEKILPINIENLRRLGIDEISLVKGQGKFIVVLVDARNTQISWISFRTHTVSD